MKWMKRIAIASGVLYLVVCTLLFAFQEELLFHPRPRPENHQYGNFVEEWIQLPDGDRLHALHLPAEGGPGEGVILYLHGNVGDNGRSLYQTRSLEASGYDRFLVDYRGFGKSDGEIDEEADMTKDLQVVYDRLKATYGEDRIILAGYSMGSGPATYLAAQNDPAGMVLVAPYTSLVDMKNEFFWMFPDLLMKYELNNYRHLAASSCPVYIVHGTADELIPFSMAERLRDLDPDRITLVPLAGVGHRGAVLNSAFGEAIAALTTPAR